MKKLFFFAAAALAMLSAASCQKEPVASVEGGNAVVSLSIALPEAPQTRAIAQAENADIVYFEVWNSDWTKKLPVQDKNGNPFNSAKVTDRKANIELTLVADQTYNFLFWAQNEACGAYDVTDLKNVKIKYDVMADPQGKDDSFDAFYKADTIKVNGAVNETVVLYRPFAQLNFATNRMKTSFGDVVLGDSEVTVKGLATSFNTIKGVGEIENEPATVTFKANGLATDVAGNTEMLKTNGGEYTWLTMDYMLMKDKSDLVEVEASFDLGMDVPVEHKIANVPLKKNYRTNIIGDVFAADAKLQIIIDQAFLKQDEDITVGVPEEIKPDGNVYNVTKPGHIIWLSQESQKNVAAFEGKTLNFTADIDMMGQGFLPINIWGDNVVTVLGNGHKVFNFSVRGDSYRVGDEKSLEHAGLFGTMKGNISDLHVKDVLVEGNFSAGALVGYIYGSVENCSATNVTINSIPYGSIVNGTFIYDDGNNVGGLIGYVGEDPDYKILKNKVDGAVLTGYRCIGGIAGTVQKGVEVTDNNVTNSTITVDMAYVPYVDAPKTAYAGDIVGRMISADDLSDNSFDNVTITNLEVVTTAEEFQAALDAGEFNIVLMPGTYEGTFTLKAPATIVGKGEAIVHCLNLNGKEGVTLKNITFDAAGAQSSIDRYKGGTVRSSANIISGNSDNNPNVGARNLVIDGCTFTGTFANRGAAIAFTDRSRPTGGSGNVTIKGCTFDTKGGNYDVYGYYTSAPGLTFTIENNVFKSTYAEEGGWPIYLGRLKSSAPIVVKGNAFENVQTIEKAVFIQGDGYTPTLDHSDNTFAN